MKIYAAFFHSHISPTLSIFTKQLDTPEKMAQQQKQQKEPSAEWVESETDILPIFCLYVLLQIEYKYVLQVKSSGIVAYAAMKNGFLATKSQRMYVQCRFWYTHFSANVMRKIGK